ncbi:HNH endonuclease family protein [Aquihabitans daechungensis]|uniref:HNH endonuclease family protein n=1 Tax=Aquihabitans daechungensis TaxID=1052257 RepID=UPI003BA2771D
MSPDGSVGDEGVDGSQARADHRRDHRARARAGARGEAPRAGRRGRDHRDADHAGVAHLAGLHHVGLHHRGRAAGASPASTTTATTTTTVAATTTTPDPGEVGSAEEILGGLAVRTADPAAPYVRDLFDGGDWAYDPATGCNTRELVLIDESVIEPEVDDRCRTTRGRWRSSYDGVTTDDPADLQIDHFIPLADAWRSGASAWSSERRLAFANDRSSPDTLIAVTGSTNQSKGDSTPDEWLPPDETAWCTYAEQWVRVKAAWDLSVTAPEQARLGELLAAC